MNTLQIEVCQAGNTREAKCGDQASKHTHRSLGAMLAWLFFANMQEDDYPHQAERPRTNASYTQVYQHTEEEASKKCACTWKYQPAYLLSLYGNPPPPFLSPSRPTQTLGPVTLTWCEGPTVLRTAPTDRKRGATRHSTDGSTKQGARVHYYQCQ